LARTVRITTLIGASGMCVLGDMNGRAFQAVPAADLTSAVAIEDGTEQVGGSVIAEEIDGRWIKPGSTDPDGR